MDADLCFQQGPLIADIAVRVFSFLSVKERQSVAKVCRYWRSTVYQARLWKNVHVIFPLRSSDTLIRSLRTRRITSFTFLRSTEQDLSSLLTNITHLTHLHLKGCPLVGEECLKRMLVPLTNLQDLLFSRCGQLTDDVLVYYADNIGSLDKLKCLTLEDCAKVTHVGFECLIKKLKHLESLHLTWCKNLNNSCLETLSESCPQLRCLRLSSCDWVTLDGLQHITKLKHIKNLDLRYSHSIDDECVHLVASQLDLQALDVFGIPSLTFEAIAFAARQLKGLRRLSFEGGEFFADYIQQLEEMFTEISKLTELESFTSDTFATQDECYDEDIELYFVSLLKKLPNLKQLHIGETIGEDTANTIADYMPELTSLKLSSSMIKDDSITTLCTSLKKLKSLELHNCSVSDVGIRAIATGPCDLDSLILSNLPDMTDEGLGYIASSLSSLNSLDVIKCKVTDAGLTLLAEGMPQLVSLNLSFCRQISNKGALAIGKHCKQLQQLMVDYTQISDEGFVFVCKHLQHLRTLSVGHCPLTDKGFIDGAMFLNNLEELDVGSDEMTDKGLREAVKHLGGLMEMALNCPSVTEVGVQYLVTELPNLNHLGIEHPLLSEATIRRLQTNGKATICLYEN